MSETVLKILIAELALVRIICRHNGCNGVVEVPMDRLEDAFRHHQCPVCQKEIYGTADTYLEDLGRAIQRINKFRKSFDVEFVIPQGGR